MKYAVLSDVHANLEALTAVLDAVDREGVDLILCLGDFVGYHADPNQCIDLLRSRRVLAVAGNHDRAAVGTLDPRRFGALGKKSAEVTRRLLSEDNRRWLEQLPMSRLAGGDVLIVHGAIHPEPNDEIHLSTRERVKCSMAALRSKHPGVALAFFGHTHHPVVHRFSKGKTTSSSPLGISLGPDGVYLVNPGSVGQSRDRDPRAAFAIYDPVARTIAFRRVDYDQVEALRKARAAGLLDLEERTRFRPRRLLGRAAAASLLGARRAARFVSRLRAKAPSPWLTVLAYHRICDPDSRTVLDEGVVDATPSAFERQMAFIAENFHAVGIDELRAFARGQALPANPLAITFDDGYLDNYRHALPVLKRHGLTATFFVATSFIGARRVFWWDRMAYVLRSSDRDVVELSYPYHLKLRLANGRLGAIRRLLRLVKDHADLDLEHLLEELEVAAAVAFPRSLERDIANELVMTWDQVRALRSMGMDVQSHTRTHRELHTIAPARLHDELAGSRADLEAELSEPVRAVSYPIGRPIADSPAIRNEITESGYELGFAMVGGVNAIYRKLDPLDVHRIGVDRAWSDEQFRGILALPCLAR